MRRFINARLNSPSILKKDMNTARSVICPINPKFPFCTRNEVFHWEKAGLSDELVIQFCTTTPNACSEERLWNADSCDSDFNGWSEYFLRPTTRFQLIENIKNSLKTLLGKDMDDNAWNQEVFYATELAIPAVIASYNNNTYICDLIFQK